MIGDPSPISEEFAEDMLNDLHNIDSKDLAVMKNILANEFTKEELQTLRDNLSLIRRTAYRIWRKK